MPKFLITLVIFLVLVTAGFLFLNPSEMLRQSRDQEREKDLNNLQKAIETYSDNNPSAVLVGSSFCPACVEGKVYTYSGEVVEAGSPTTSRASLAVNSTGWVPLDLSLNAKIGTTPLKSLPLDPLEKINLALSKIPFLNSLSPKRQGFVYTFSATKTGKYKITAKMESKVGLEKAKNDGGTQDDRLEVGNDLNLKP